METWAGNMGLIEILIEIFMLCRNLPSGPNHRGSLQKNKAFSEDNQLLTANFHANLDEINPDMIQFTKRWNWK